MEEGEEKVKERKKMRVREKGGRRGRKGLETREMEIERLREGESKAQCAGEKLQQGKKMQKERKRGNNIRST